MHTFPSNDPQTHSACLDVYALDTLDTLDTFDLKISYLLAPFTCHR